QFVNAIRHPHAPNETFLRGHRCAVPRITSFTQHPSGIAIPRDNALAAEPFGAAAKTRRLTRPTSNDDADRFGDARDPSVGARDPSACGTVPLLATATAPSASR